MSSRKIGHINHIFLGALLASKEHSKEGARTQTGPRYDLGAGISALPLTWASNLHL